MRKILWLLSALLVSGLTVRAGEEKAEKSEKDAKACFDKLDADHDGSLSQDEFSAGCKGSRKHCKGGDSKSDDHSSDSKDDGKSADDGDEK
jgi:hypothetical protein